VSEEVIQLLMNGLLITGKAHKSGDFIQCKAVIEKLLTLIMSYDYNQDAFAKKFYRLYTAINALFDKTQAGEVTHEVFYAQIDDALSKFHLNPTKLRIELTRLCNLRCRYCACNSTNPITAQTNKKHMSWDVLRNIAEQAKEIETLNELSVCGYGETFMNKEWFEMICYVLETVPQIKKVLIQTNGMLNTKENIDKVAQLPCERISFEVSIDGISAEETEYWRVGSKFETIKESLNYAISRLDKNKTEIWLFNVSVLPKEFLTGGKTFHDAMAHISKGNEWLRSEFPGVTVHSGYVHNYPGHAVDGTVLWEVANPDASSKISCAYRFVMIAVDPGGDILSCPCDATDVFVLGNVAHDNMLNVWTNNAKLNEIRKMIITETGATPCDQCNANPSAVKRMLIKTT